MVEFSLTEKQKALRALVRDFVDREVKPVAAERDRMSDPSRIMPWEVIEGASRLGLRTLCVPEKDGGGGADILTTCIVGEELAVGDLGIAVAFDQTWKYTYILTERLNPGQRKRWLKRFLEDDRCLLAIGFTEPDYGSDNFMIETGPSLGMRLDAKPAAGGWVLNGMKHFISNGGTAGVYFIAARTDRTAGIDEGVTTFILDRDTPGFTIGRTHDKLGQRLVQNAELIFQDCFVPDDQRISPVGKGIVYQKDLAKKSHVEAAATVLGPARRAFEETLEYARNRVQGGRPIVRHQAVAMMLAEMEMLIEASRAYIWSAAWRNEHQEPFDPKLGMLTKVFVSEAAYKVCTLAMEVWGGMGYMRDAPIEKCLRDAASFLHSDGTNQVHRIKAAQSFARG
ncbi:MAG: acyl-CoA dehydrogenase family protein [Candidatus Tectomicrobia bacterium]|nr:acyl-CoA dehydrogenase family protein [Candidatus Tectomicrobia bacterium]